MVNSEEVKSRGHKAIDEIKEAVACVVIVSDTDHVSAAVVGEGKELVKTLANLMVENKDFRRMCGVAYTLSAAKEG